MSTLAWSHRVSEIRTAKSFTAQADQSERQRLSERIGNAQCLALEAAYTIRPDGATRFEVGGRVTARLEQICGVTLDAMFQEIDEPINVVFEERVRGEVVEEVAFDPLGDDPPEAILNGRLDIGEFIAEIVVSAADPFPRLAETTLDRTESLGDAGRSQDGDNPFDALKQLASRTDEADD